MRDAFAGVLAVVLLFVAASLATTLRAYRRRRSGARESQRVLGRRIIVELPTSDELVLVSEDDERVYYGERSIAKDDIIAVRVLINGAPIAEYVSTRHLRDRKPREAVGFDDRPEGIARDRWDVAVETHAGSTLIECGAIRERVSQELARAIFDRLKLDIVERDQETDRARGGD